MNLRRFSESHLVTVITVVGIETLDLSLKPEKRASGFAWRYMGVRLAEARRLSGGIKSFQIKGGHS